MFSSWSLNPQSTLTKGNRGQKPKLLTPACTTVGEPTVALASSRTQVPSRHPKAPSVTPGYQPGPPKYRVCVPTGSDQTCAGSSPAFRLLQSEDQIRDPFLVKIRSRTLSSFRQVEHAQIFFVRQTGPVDEREIWGKQNGAIAPNAKRASGSRALPIN